MGLSVRRKEMIAITQCPECSTRFKVTEAQLDAHDGLVRCGRCHDVFNAREHLHDDEPSPQLSLPIEPEAIPLELAPIPDASEAEEKPVTLAQQVQFYEELTDEVPHAPPAPRRHVLSKLATLVLAATLLAQAAYFFRVELAARLPGIKPLLVQYCTLLDCTVALPQKTELMVLESSELESDPRQGRIITLHALLHNRAPYAQAYPHLELTLTDLQDQPVARRLFSPADYLPPGKDEKLGIPPNRDFDLKLRLDTTDLKPTGYRLALFYPQ